MSKREEIIFTCPNCGEVEDITKENFHYESPDGRAFQAGAVLLCSTCKREVEETVKEEEEDEDV